MSNEYNGPECQVKYAVPASTKFKLPKPNASIAFYNADNENVGSLDFNGPGLTFEGNAEMSAVVFIDWLAKKFTARMKEEYEKGFAAGKDLSENKA
jgi:hypothetical protein